MCLAGFRFLYIYNYIFHGDIFQVKNDYPANQYSRQFRLYRKNRGANRDRGYSERMGQPYRLRDKDIAEPVEYRARRLPMAQIPECPMDAHIRFRQPARKNLHAQIRRRHKKDFSGHYPFAQSARILFACPDPSEISRGIRQAGRVDPP